MTVQNTPALRTQATLAIQNDAFNQFATKEDMDEHILTLAGIATDFVIAMPIVQHVYNWPPANVILDRCVGKSKLIALYNALFDELSENGYPVSVLMTMQVLQHVPKRYTLLTVPLSARLGPLH